MSVDGRFAGIPAFAQFDLTGKSVLITGGATGIGLAMTKALAGAGATVMMAARREHVLRDAAEKLMTEPGIGTVLWHQVDLVDRESVKALADHAVSSFDGVDIFVGNAGFDTQEPIDDITDDALDQQIRVNLTANIELTRELLPHMRRKKWGRFIYCSSAASQLGSANDLMSVYGAAKSGLNSFARYVAAEAGRDGITANSLILGIYLTEMVEEHFGKLSDEARHEYMVEVPSMIPLGRPAATDEIAGIVQLLASDAGSYITGGCVPADGGMTAMLRPNRVVPETQNPAPDAQGGRP